MSFLADEEGATRATVIIAETAISNGRAPSGIQEQYFL